METVKGPRRVLNWYSICFALRDDSEPTGTRNGMSLTEMSFLGSHVWTFDAQRVAVPFWGGGGTGYRFQPAGVGWQG